MKKVNIKNNVFIGENIEIEEGLDIGENNLIMAINIRIGKNVKIGSNNEVLVNNFSIGNTCYIGNNNLIEGRLVDIGKNTWWGNENVVGHGGKWGINSNFKLGAFSMVVGKCIFNLSDEITIGENVGIGGEVNIWTHGTYLPVLKGFPINLGPVTIGDYVWIPARNIILPNIKIGSNVVIGINSLINKDVPSGAFVAGIPAVIIKKDCYPGPNKKDNYIENLIKQYTELCEYKNISISITYNKENNKILCNEKIFNLDTLEFPDELSLEEEDFRDFLRRNGIKFYGIKPFKSILPPVIKKITEFYSNVEK